METISYALLIEREGIQIHVSYVSQPLQGIKICYTPTEKRVQALIHTTRSLRTIFRKHKVNVVTDGPIEEILKLSKKEGRLAKWAAKIRTYDISYIPRKEVEGLVIKKFFGQGEQIKGTPDANEGGTFTLRKKLQVKSTPTPRAWRLYVGKERIEEGSGVGIILVSLVEMMHSYAILLKFHASNHVMDYEALLAGLSACINQGMKDLHVFIDSLTLVAQVEGNHTPVTEQERKYKEEILDLEFLNQEVSVGIKTKPAVEETSSSKKGKAASNAPRAEPNYNREASGNASAKLRRAELNKRFGDADLSGDKSGPESPPEFWRSWYVEGHIRFGVISSVQAQRHLRNNPTKGDEGPNSEGTKLNSTFITAEVTFTKPKQPT
ncbi:reverse transcriptase domain-containing protein [Tanacetum coccineum]